MRMPILATMRRALLLAAMSLGLAACIGSEPRAPELYTAVQGWRQISENESWLLLEPSTEAAVIARLAKQEGPRLYQRLVLANDTVLSGENYFEVMLSGDPSDGTARYTETSFLGTVSDALPGGSTVNGQSSNRYGTIIYAIAEGLGDARCIYAIQRLVETEALQLPSGVAFGTIEHRYCGTGETREQLVARIERLNFNPLLTIVSGGSFSPAF
ncbi:MAG: cellulose biosynthesis protein BcsN [Azospirillaceae bacterium]